MKATTRELRPVINKALRAFPAIVLTGPRRAGKTFLLRHLFPKASYTLMEDPQMVARLRADPRGFLDDLHLPAILDEVQNVPELFAHVRTRIDQAPQKTGQWILTGSQESSLMRGVTESMAGRAAILQLWPFSRVESPRVSLLAGGYPEVLARPKARELWFSAYVQTYLEHDVRSITHVHDLGTFRRFLSLVASRHGQMVNKTDLAAPLGMSVPGISKWLDILELTQQILLVPPYFDNLGKRIIKSPKLYLADSGLACFLLQIHTEAELRRSPFYGALFEGYVASEIAKAQANAGHRRDFYYFRDQFGLEVDFLVPTQEGTVLVECKAARSASVDDGKSIIRLRDSFADSARGKRVRGVVVHNGSEAPAPLRPHVTTMGSDAFIASLRTP